ncbi:tripartite tricarboxylate transporter TctB family protein [Microbaculum marinum]|uniref:Tripartite tricarboxylate transporter TctB family protein n=1 Tax=Microbaculum marinum TaxID=1764581 RepID=A0AAW9RI64_9HYPH
MTVPLDPELPDSELGSESGLAPDRCSGVLVLAAGVGLMAWSCTLRLGSFAVPGPGAFPLLLSAILTLLGTVLFAQQTRLGFSWDALFLLLRKKSVLIAVILGVFLFYTFTFYELGFIVVNTVALSVILIFIQRANIVTSLLYAVVLSVLSDIVFNELLGLRLPMGIFQNLGIG